MLARVGYGRVWKMHGITKNIVKESNRMIAERIGFSDLGKNEADKIASRHSCEIL